MSGYLDHFGLKLVPFRTTPDPAFAYATREHQLAVAKIQYSVEEHQGIFLLQGEIGCGKTTVSQFMLNAWRGDDSMAVAYITNPSVRTPSQFLRLILTHFGIEPPYRLQDNWDALRSMLVGNYRDGKNTTLVLDEAHTISPENMETVRKYSGGIPRWINNICHMTLMNAFLRGTRTISNELIAETSKAFGENLA